MISIKKWLATVIVVPLFSALIGQGFWWESTERSAEAQQIAPNPVQQVSSAPSPRGQIMDNERGVVTYAPLLERVTPAVVNIAAESTVQVSGASPFDDPFFRDFFDLPEEFFERGPQPKRQAQAGSGVIIDARRGYILTNHHVVENAEKLVVTLKDKRRLEGKLVGSDPDTDIALIKIDASDLTSLPLGNSDAVKVGDFVIAIGNPFGLGQSVTSGIVSALGRSGLNIERYEDFIQTDAPINPGNSGGPLINSKGEMIGVNTAIIGPRGGNVGVGFAVPANMARSVIDQIIRNGEVRRGRIGVVVQTVTPMLAEALELTASYGAVVSQVGGGSPAERAGIEPGDVILSVDDIEVADSSDLRNRIGLTEIGRTVRLGVLRGENRESITVRVETETRKKVAGENTIPQLDGATFSDIPTSMSPSGGSEGVLVSNVVQASPAWTMGLRSDDIIRAVNRRPVKDVEAFGEVLEDLDGPLALTIDRGNMRLFFLVR